MTASRSTLRGLWTRVTVLLLCSLLLTDQVRCQDDDPPADDPPADDPPADDPPADDPPADDPPADDPPADDPPANDGDATDSNSAPDVPVTAATTASVSVSPSTAAPANDQEGGAAAAAAADDDADVPTKNIHLIKAVVPTVQCVGQTDVPQSNAVMAVVETDDCETTKRIIQENAAGWCQMENCHLKIFQEGNQLLVASEDAPLGTLAKALQSERLKDKLGVTKATAPSSSGSSVFVGVLVSGLLAAAAITAGYWGCQRRAEGTGLKLAEEGSPVDQENQENQGNTLVSVAPLNPPTETEEKPNINGESPEAAKTPTPPTNGHTPSKTADTEL